MEKPYIVAFPDGTDPAIIEKMSGIVKQITEMPAYEEELRKTFKQPVSYFDTNQSIDRLTNTREDFMKYKDELRQSK